MEKNKEYDKFIDDDGVVTETAPVVVVKATKKTQIVLDEIKEIKDTGQLAIKALLDQVNSYAKNRGRELNDYQKSVAQDNLKGLEIYRTKNNLQYPQMDFEGNNIYGKMLAFATQGLNVTDNDFAIVGYQSGKTGKYVMSMNLQYQGEKKLLTKFVRINGQSIHHFFDNVVYANDIFETELDFENGEEKITHKPNKENTKEYKKNLNNVVGAYAIAYLPNSQGGYSKVQCVIDKKRIDEARNCAKSPKFWNDWPDRMVLKTAYHVLYKKMRSFIDPSILKSEDMETINPVNKERKFDNSIDVETEVKDEACNKELGVDF